MMPTKRVKRTHKQLVIGGLERIHLMEGDCLMGAGCLLCDTVGGPSSPCPRVLRMDLAAEVWAHNRDALLADWNEPRDHDWYARRADENYGFGWLGIPAFAECLFDGRTLPELNPAWPEAARNEYRAIAGNLDELREWLEANG